MRAFNPEFLAAALRGTPVAKTLSAPVQPRHVLPRAMARWEAERDLREAQALQHATTPSRAWVDGTEVEITQPVITKAEPVAQDDDPPTFVDLVTTPEPNGG